MQIELKCSIFPCSLRSGYKRRNGMFFQGRRVKWVKHCWILLKEIE